MAEVVRLEPRGMFDMTGWARVECVTSDSVKSSVEDRTVASSYTDVDGTELGVVFTEWWAKADGHLSPLLRDYRYTPAGGRECEHWIATGTEAAAKVES